MKKTLLYQFKEDRAVEIHGKRHWLCTWGPWLCYMCSHTVQALCWQTLTVVHFYTSGSAEPTKLEGAVRGCLHHSCKCYLNHPNILLSPLQRPDLGIAKLLNQRKDLECMHCWKSKGSQEKAICIEAICYFTNWYLLSFNFTLPYLPLQPVCSRQSIHFTVAIAEPFVLRSRTLCHSFNLKMCCINCLNMWLLIVFKQPVNI